MVELMQGRGGRGVAWLSGGRALLQVCRRLGFHRVQAAIPCSPSLKRHSKSGCGQALDGAQLPHVV